MAEPKIAAARRGDGGDVQKVRGPPKTRKEDVTVHIHGRPVNDPYNWLNNSESPEVKRWVADHNAYARRFLDGSEVREHIRERLRELENEEHIEEPSPAAMSLADGTQRYFQFRQAPNQEYKVLYYMDGLDGELKVAIDPNKFRNGKTSMINYFPTDDGTKIAYTESFRGSDSTTIKVVDLETGKVLKDAITNVTFGSVSWLEDNSGFYYSKWPDLVDYPQSKRTHHVFFHQLGTDQSKDVGIFGKGLGADYSCYSWICSDSSYLIIGKSDNVDNELYYRKLGKNTSPEIKPLIVGKNAEFQIIDIVDNVAYVLTNLGAPNYKVISFNMDRPSEKNWKTVIKEGDDAISDITRIDNKLIVNYVRDVYSEIKVFSLGGRMLAEVDLPIRGSATTPQADYAGKEAFFTLGSSIHEDRLYRLDLKTYKVEKFDKKKDGLDLSKYELKQVWYESRDGTIVPMFMVNKKGIKKDGNNPVILYGYGGFNLPTMPDFDHRIIPFLEDGGIWCMANIRGGGEYGRNWYEDGMHKNRQQSYDDFIAAAEWLIKSKYTNSKRIAMRGRSNGGLLTAAVMAQRPELFRAVISEMPLTDIISADRFDIGPLCKREYGDPNRPEDFDFIMRYSPYHNIRDGVHYPSLLVVGGENDTRCDPLHARKFAAIVQNSTASGNPVLLLMQRDIGHGGATMPVKKSQQLEWTTDWLTFIYKELGMEEDVRRKKLQKLQRTG